MNKKYGLGIFQHIKAKSRCQFTQLATWQRNSEKLVFSAPEINKEYLGYLIRNEALQIAAYDEVESLETKKPIFIGDCSLSAIDSRSFS